MSTSLIFPLLALAATAVGHGIVTSAIAEGVTEIGYNPEMQWTDPGIKTIGWNTPANIELGFIHPDGYTGSDIICNLGATNAQKSLTVKAGDTVKVQWSPWPESHHGPVLDYLARCKGDSCANADKASLEFFKISEKGLNNYNVAPGDWATDDLIRAGNTWTVTIPKSIQSGEYVLRTEIIALHAAHDQGAENYPQCINLLVTDGGDSVPAGTLGTKLYTPGGPGIDVDIYDGMTGYAIPGPALWSAGSGSTATPTATPTSTSTAKPTTSTTKPTTTASSTSTSTTASSSATATATSTATKPSTTAAPSATESAADEYSDSPSSSQAAATSGCRGRTYHNRKNNNNNHNHSRRHIRDFS